MADDKPTDKQISFAIKLGILDGGEMTKHEIHQAIERALDVKNGDKPKDITDQYPKGFKEGHDAFEKKKWRDDGLDRERIIARESSAKTASSFLVGKMRAVPGVGFTIENLLFLAEEIEKWIYRTP